MRKRATALLLAAALLLGLSAPAGAERDYTPQAEALKALGLFLGTDRGFELERAATRAEAAVMLVRLLGKEQAAREQQPAHPFEDVPEWAGPYVGYLYQSNITRGVSHSAFGAADLATAAQYATFVLRALEYDDAAGDFDWSTALTSMAEWGIITAAQQVELAAGETVSRNHVVALSYAALLAAPKGRDLPLLRKLHSEDGVISDTQLAAAAAIDQTLAALAGGAPAPDAPTSPMTQEQLLAYASPAVFLLESDALPAGDGGSGNVVGSGFFLSADGLAVTSCGALTSAPSLRARTADGAVHQIAGAVAIDPGNDLALIRVGGSGFSALPLGDSAEAKAGQTLSAVGHHSGTAAALQRSPVVKADNSVADNDNKFLQLGGGTLASGAPLLNDLGRVVGMASRSHLADSVNLGIPSAALQALQRQAEGALRPLRYLELHAPLGELPVWSGDIAPAADGQALAARETVRGSIAKGEAHRYSAEVVYEADAVFSLFSPQADLLTLELLDASGRVLATALHNAGQPYLVLQTRLPASQYPPREQRYTVRVSAAASLGAEASYDLYWNSVEQVPERAIGYIEPAPLPVAHELERNDSLETATYLFHQSPSVQASFSSPADVDYYRFTVHSAEAVDGSSHVIVVESKTSCRILLQDKDGITRDSATINRPESDGAVLLLLPLEDEELGTKETELYLRILPLEQTGSWTDEVYTITFTSDKERNPYYG